MSRTNQRRVRVWVTGPRTNGWLPLSKNARLQSSLPSLRLYREIPTSDWPLPRVTSTAKAGGAAQRSSAVAMVADCSVGSKQRDTLKRISPSSGCLASYIRFTKPTVCFHCVFPPNHCIFDSKTLHFTRGWHFCDLKYASFVQSHKPTVFCWIFDLVLK